MDTDIKFENIYLSLTEDDSFNENIDIDLLLNELNNQNSNIKDNEIHTIKMNDLYSQCYHYDINFNIQQLLAICDYYNIVKTNKLKKENKINIIHKLVEFENDLKNYDIVVQRKKLWFYMNELKKDKIMKKYILW
jgi:hypothetical protein